MQTQDDRVGFETVGRLQVDFQGGDADENYFTLTRTGIEGRIAAVFGIKKEIPVKV